jgi:phosphomannomutase/phosphoglucomutase
MFTHILTGFKECDIRGEFGTEITAELAYRLGRAVGSVTRQQKVVIGGDFRTSTPELLAEVKRGLIESDSAVYDLGQVSTPCYYFARRRLVVTTGVMVTASHGPPDHNGFKPVLGELPITPEELATLKHLVMNGEFASGCGTVENVEIKTAYIDWLAERFASVGKSLPKVVFDCGNGATGWVLGDLLKALDVGATILFEEPDGTFPNRSPDIAGLHDLTALQVEVTRQEAELGAGFDGDGDRVGFVDECGRRVSQDRLIAWLAREVLRTEPGGTVISDVKLSKVVPETVRRCGGKAIVQKSGHTFIKRAMREHGAIFGGEYSGHLFFRELDGGDDGLFSALFVCSLIGESGRPFSRVVAGLPGYESTPEIRIRYVGDAERVIRDAAARAGRQGARLVLVDGVRAEYDEGWALMRASVTEPALTFRFEGNTRADILTVAQRFLSGLGGVGERVWKRIVEEPRGEIV